MHKILFMSRGRPRNGGDDVDVWIDVDDETRDEECSLLKKSLSVLRTFGQLGLNPWKRLLMKYQFYMPDLQMLDSVLT